MIHELEKKALRLTKEGQYREAVCCLDQARDVYEAEGDISSLARACAKMGILTEHLERPEDASAHFLHAVRAAEKLGEEDWRLRVRILDAYGGFLLRQQRMDEFAMIIDRLFELLDLCREEAAWPSITKEKLELYMQSVHSRRKDRNHKSAE